MNNTQKKCKCKYVKNMHKISWPAYLKPLSARRAGQSIYIFMNSQRDLGHWLEKFLIKSLL